MTTDWIRSICLAWLLLVSFPAKAATPMVAAGTYFALALKADGTVTAWGRSDNGQLGNGSSAMRALPFRVPGIDQAKAAAAGSGFTLALRADGTLWAWGGNGDGELGDGATRDRSYPVRVTGITGTITALASGDLHTLALGADGKVWTWGYGGFGALGTGGVGNRTAAVQVSGLPVSIRAVASGSTHSLALADDGSVWSWGDNAYGQLGTGTTVAALIPRRINALSGIVAISALGYSNLALDATGRVWAWGRGSRGALGDGTTIDRTTPFAVAALPEIASIKAGNNISIATARADGSVWVWGNNEASQFGDPQYSSQPSPVKVTNLTGLAEFAVGDMHVIARDASGAVRSWGRNDKGQLGLGDTDDRPTPTVVAGLSPSAQVAVGLTHSVSVAADGTVWVWGTNGAGELADGSVAVGNIPVEVPGLTNISAVAAGFLHGLALGADGSVWGWGGNDKYQLGDTSRRDALTPKQVSGLPAMAAVAAGLWSSFAIDRNGQLWSWGSNGTSGQLGTGVTSGFQTPRALTALSDVTRIAARNEHALAVKRDGSVWSWGSNGYGQLGDGTTFNRSTPVRVVGLTDVTAVSAGSFHSLALDLSGAVWSWGYNFVGQLGDGTDTNSLTPVRVSGLSNVVAIAAGDNLSCAITTDGRLWTWGLNDSGQLGDGTLFWWWPYPSAIPDLAGFQSLSCANNFAVAMRSDGTVWTWGRNFEGQLGDGTFAAHNQPVLAANETLTGALDLIPQFANSIPAGKTPPFLARATRTGDLSRISLAVDVKGITGTGAFAAGSDSGRFTAAYNVYVAASVLSGGTPIYFQLDSGNNWSALQWPMAEFLRGVALDSQNNVVTAQILKDVDVSQLAGAIIIVGYGTHPDEMLGNARYRTIFTVPNE